MVKWWSSKSLLGVQFLPTPLFFMFTKIKRNLKFLLKIQYDEGDAIITKIAPILNQLNMEETSFLDDFLFSFFSNIYQEEFEDEIFTSTLNYANWKNFNFFNQITIKPFLFHELLLKYHKNDLKKLFFFKDHVIFNNFKDLKFRIFIAFYFLIYSVEGTTWNPDFGFCFSLKDFDNSLFSLIGMDRAYSKRSEMLGRKINFRRKIKKQRFEDY